MSIWSNFPLRFNLPLPLIGQLSQKPVNHLTKLPNICYSVTQSTGWLSPTVLFLGPKELLYRYRLAKIS